MTPLPKQFLQSSLTTRGTGITQVKPLYGLGIWIKKSIEEEYNTQKNW